MEPVQPVVKQSSFLVILLSTLLIISYLIASFFAWKTQKLVKQLQGIMNEELVKQTPVPTATPNPTISLTPEDLKRGWYWGSVDQRKKDTPEDWIHTEAGRSSAWHNPNIKPISTW